MLVSGPVLGSDRPAREGHVIRVFEDHESVSRAAAELFSGEATASVRARGRFAVALAGGATPRRAYEILAGHPFRERVPWHGVHVFWTDERCVPRDDPRSNERMAREALLDFVAIPEEQIHPFACGEGGAEEAATRSELELRRVFGEAGPRFDLVFLGLGADGHTASLFPGSPAIEEAERWVAPVRPPGSEFGRVTLSVPVLNGSALVAFLVSGSGKAGALRALFGAPFDPNRLPAQAIRPDSGRLLWLVDREAKGGLDVEDR